MGRWSEVHDSIRAIQDRARREFLTSISDESLAIAINGVMEHRLSEFLHEQFEKLTPKDLLTALEIVKTDKSLLEKAQAERPKRGGLN